MLQLRQGPEPITCPCIQQPVPATRTVCAPQSHMYTTPNICSCLSQRPVQVWCRINLKQFLLCCNRGLTCPLLTQKHDASLMCPTGHLVLLARVHECPYAHIYMSPCVCLPVGALKCVYIHVRDRVRERVCVPQVGQTFYYNTSSDETRWTM